MTISDYATLTDAKAAWPSSSLASTTIYDTLATALLARCSRWFDSQTKRKPGAYAVSADVTRYFDAPAGNAGAPVYRDNRLSGYSGNENGKLHIGELASAPTSVGVSTNGSVTVYTALASTDYLCGPWNALDQGKPYQWLQLDFINGSHATWYGFPMGVKVVGKFGYSTAAPDDVKSAVLELVIQALRRAEQNYVDTGVMLDTSVIMQGLKLNQYVNDVVNTYRKVTI